LATLDIPAPFKNPFRPGAGHMPPYLAGREEEQREFERLLDQEVILENMVLTGLRGVGKTVLLDTFKPLAISRGWLWVGTDLSESTSVTEQNLAIRLLADLAVISSSLVVGVREAKQVGFTKDPVRHPVSLDFANLMRLYEATPGLVADKVKTVLETVWERLKPSGKRGVVFAYDEAQNLADYPAKDQYPLSLLLDVFQSIQKKGVPFMLVLTGLPTLFSKLVEARTFAERMFRVVMLSKLSPADSREAVVKPIQAANCPVHFDPESVETICDHSGGYPYFIQFICREVYDVFIASSGTVTAVPVEAITRKLDTDFFTGRWARATDRQRELLMVMADLGKAEGEFTVQEIAARSAHLLPKGFSGSHANQMLASLCEAGLLYKNRHGRYSFAVPLFDRFIIRQLEQQIA